MLHPTPEALHWEDTPATYDQILAVLKHNHFISAKELYLDKKGTSIIGLQVEAAPILQESKKARILEVLKDFPVDVQRLANKDFLLVTLKK